MASTRAMITGMAVAAVCLAASGCGPATMASVAVSGISVAFTGKGLAEHAISGIRDEDCAVLNVLDGGTMCVPYEDAPRTVAVAALVPEDGAAPEVDIDDINDLAVASGSATGQDAVAHTDTRIEAPVAVASAQPQWRAPLPAAVEDDPVWRYMMARVRSGADPAAASPYSAGPLASVDSGSAGKVSP